MSAPEWLVVGADVVEFTPTSFGSGGGHIVPAKVDKIGKRDVVLDTGTRFNVERLRKQRGQWDPDTYLLQPNDERVIRAKAANCTARLRHKADTAYDAWRRDRSTENARALRDAVDAVLRDAAP